MEIIYCAGLEKKCIEMSASATDANKLAAAPRRAALLAGRRFGGFLF